MPTALRAVIGARRVPRVGRWLAALFAFAVLASVAALAQISTRVAIPDAPARFLHDGAGLLTSAEKSRIEQKLMSLDRRGLEIGVAIFRSLEGDALEDVTMAIAEKWQPGAAERDDGAVLAIFIEDRKIRIELGFGLEEYLTDAQAGRIIRNILAPEFRRRRYADGIMGAIEAIEASVDGREVPALEREERGIPMFVVFLIVFLLLFFLSRRRGDSVWIDGRGWHQGRRYRGPWVIGGGGGGRGGGFGGGFGGGSFGGGGFGGGGASGGW